MSIRHAAKLISSSQLKLLPSSQICVMRLSSYDSKKFLQSFGRNRIHVTRTVRTVNSHGSTSSSKDDLFENPIIQKCYSFIRESLMIISFGAICILLFLKSATPKHPAVIKALEAEAFEFNEFLTRILPTGEVARIIYFPERQRLIAILHEGALINGKSYTNGLISIKLNDKNPLNNEFLTRLRNAEGRLGLPFSERIPLEPFRGGLLYQVFNGVMLSSVTGYYGYVIYKRISRLNVQARDKEVAAAKKAAAKATGKK